jgi:hypothetical protein
MDGVLVLVGDDDSLGAGLGAMVGVGVGCDESVGS